MKRYIRASKLSDKPSDVQLELAKNPNISEDELEELICDGSDWYKVRHALACNPNMTTELLHQLVLTEHNLDVFKTVVRNSKTSAEDLRRIVKKLLGKEKYGCWHTLAILATHPNVPEDVLEVLKHSEDSSVRSNANADPRRRAMYFEHYKVN